MVLSMVLSSVSMDREAQQATVHGLTKSWSSYNQENFTFTFQELLYLPFAPDFYIFSSCYADLDLNITSSERSYLTTQLEETTHFLLHHSFFIFIYRMFCYMVVSYTYAIWLYSYTYIFISHHRMQIWTDLFCLSLTSRIIVLNIQNHAWHIIDTS